ncbi:unnamed protein product [Sphagnum troendelagicum]|uniref:Uncharacterized protein n=1 Tax=Sphagnum troendelagicum TaxID=128251 RepID=A0ABP0UNC4_9BRYO
MMSQLQCTGDSRCTQMCSMGRSIVVCIIFCTREVTNPTGADGHGHASAMAWRYMLLQKFSSKNAMEKGEKWSGKHMARSGALRQQHGFVGGTIC